MSARQFDVAIIGGGPAGLSAALTFATAGARVVVCEAKTYPLSRVCGEFLSPECAGLFAALGLPALPSRLGGVPIDTVSLTASSGATWQTRLPGTAWGLSRRTLDSALAHAAVKRGVVVHEGAAVKNVSGNLRAGFRLETQSTGSARTARGWWTR